MKKFTESHEWIEVLQDIGTVGITHHAQKELGDIVYIELPAIGAQLLAGKEAAVLESTKAAADVYAPLSGEVVQVNEALIHETQLVNESPEEKGWLFKIKVQRSDEEKDLLDEKGYEALLRT